MSLRFTIALMLLVVVLSGTSASAQSGSDTGAPAPAQNDAAATCDRHELSTLYKCILHDLRKVARKDSLTWLAAGGAVAAGSLLLDDEVTTAVTDPESHAWLAPGDPLGDATLHFAAPLALYVAARTTDHAGAAGVAVMLLRTQVDNGILTRSLKMLPRTRPYQETGIVGEDRFRLATPQPHSPPRRCSTDDGDGAALGIASGLTVSLPARQTAVLPILAPGVAGVRVEIR